MSRFTTALVALIALAGCNGLQVTRPATEGAPVVPDENGRITVEVSSFGWELKPAGECEGRANCGHLEVWFSEDEQTGENAWTGARCGEVIEVEGTSFEVDLHTCTRQTGFFSVGVFLSDDDHVRYEGGGVATFRRFIVED